MQPLSFFQLTQTDGVAHLCLNRPKKANSMDSVFWTELPSVIHDLEQATDIRALVISGEGKHFSSGMDISNFNGIYDILAEEPGRASYLFRQEALRLQASFNVLEKARFPVIAAVHGVCIGAGIDMISACDIRLAASETTFSIEETNVGMTADLGTLQRMPKLIAPGIVKELALTGRRFTADEAMSWGFVNRVCPNREETISAALEMAKEIASKSPLVSSGVKHAINYAIDHSIPDSLEQIASWNAGMLKEEDMKLAINAKMERKKTIFADLLKIDPDGKIS